MASGGSHTTGSSPVTTLSSRAGSQRSAHPGPASTSHLESTITRLLVATKQLLEGLARWSRREVDESVISDIYVKLGNDFNTACAAFAKEGITMNELLSVPADLRVCLETCLSDQPSQASLERHLPQVRQIIIGLLHGLREKQRLYREGVAARRQREASRANQQQQQQQTLVQQSQAGGSGTLTPTSASRSRDDLRRFVTQAQQQTVPMSSTAMAGPGPTASTSNDARRYEGDVGATSAAAQRSTSDQGLPGTTTSSVGADPRYSKTMSSRSSGSTLASATGSISAMRSSSLRDSSRSISTRPALEDAFGPIQSPPPQPPSAPSTQSRGSVASSNSGNRLTRSASSASLDTQSIAAPSASLNGDGSNRPTLERSATTSSRVMTSPPPPSRRRGDDPIPALPPTPTTIDTFGPVVTASSSTGSASSSSVPNPFARPPSAASMRSFQDEPASGGAQAASLEALRADNLSRRASKRYSAYAIQKMTSPGSGGGTSPAGGGGGAGGAATTGGGGMSPSQSASPFLGQDEGSRSVLGVSSSAGRELAGIDTPRRSKSEYFAHSGSSSSSSSSRHGGGHRSNSSHSHGRRGDVPPLPPIPRSYTVGGVVPASPIAEEEYERSIDSIASPALSAGPPTFPPPPVPVEKDSTTSSPTLPQRSPSSSSLSRPAHSTTPRPASPSVQLTRQPSIPNGIAASVVSYSASEPEYPCSIFLQIGRNVKKAQLGSPPELASLRQLFVERFSYNPGLGEWPEIYLRDADSGVHYQLEEMSEIRAGSVLSLNVDTVEQVKTHIDHGLASLAQEMKELRATVSAMRPPSIVATNGLLSPSHRDSVMSLSGTSPKMRPSPSERDFQQAAKRVLHSQTPSRVTSTIEVDAKDTAVAGETAPSETIVQSGQPEAPTTGTTTATSGSNTPIPPATATAPIVETLKSQHADVQSLRQEIAVLRQVYADWQTKTKTMFASVRVQTSHVQHLAKTKLSTNRAFVEAGTARLDTESEALVVTSNELNDTLETLRDDLLRGVKPRPQVLSETATALRQATETREKLSAWLKEVKPVWSQTWSEELAKVIGEQKAVEQQQTLVDDLGDDFAQAASTFAKIDAISKTLKPTSRAVKVREREFGGAENAQEGLSTVLLEVKALSPDPTRRLEAIQRAEQQRQAELASRTDDFAEELGEFVGQKRLKKSGGIEETERVRQARSEATLRNMFAS